MDTRTNNFKAILGILLLSVTIFGCSKDELNSEVPFELLSFDNNGEAREYKVFVPLDLADNATLVIYLHGDGGAAGNSSTAFNELADQEKFVVAYPQGLRHEVGTPTWNAAYYFNDADDINFLPALAEHLQNEFNLDPEKTYVCGLSSGGFMAYRCIAERPESFAASCPMMANIDGFVWDQKDSFEPKPILHIAGEVDEGTPPEGSMGSPSLIDLVTHWASINECSEMTEVERIGIQGYEWHDCINNNEVLYHIHDAKGHQWYDSFATEAWTFFKAH